MTDIVPHGIHVFSPEIDAMVRELAGLGSFDNEIHAYWLLEAQDLLHEARTEGEAMLAGRSVTEQQVLIYISSLLDSELHRARETWSTD